MKNLLKYTIAVGVASACALSVQADPTLVVNDGAGIMQTVTVSSGNGGFSYSDSDWSVVGILASSYPPAIGKGGTAATPYMDLDIQATYIGNGTAGNPLIISWANDQFGPTTGTFDGQFSGHVVSGTGLPITFTEFYSAGSHLPTLGSPTPGTTKSETLSPVGGFYSGTEVAGPVTLGNPYTLGEEIIINGAASGSSYSLDGSITTVPDGGMTLVFLGSALSALAFLKRKLA